MDLRDVAVLDVLADPRLAIGRLWNGYVVMVHATIYLAGVLLALPVLALLRRDGAGARAATYAAALVGTLGVSLLCWAPVGWWAWLIPGMVAEPMLRLGATATAVWVGSDARDVRPLAALYLLWVVGAAVLLARLACGWLTMRAVARRAAPVTDAAWTRLLREACARMGTGQCVELRASPEVGTPLAFGLLDPVILLPADADAWTAEQRRIVLLHELAHVRRADALVQAVAQLARAWYWFHPGVCWALGGLRDAREEACDARVIAAGVRPSDYAACLLRVSDGARGARGSDAVALAMARAPRLERSIRRVLAGRPATPAPRRLASAALAACAGWALLLGTVRLAPARAAVLARFDSADWADRAYAAQLFSRTRSPALRAAVDARVARDPHPLVRRLARDPR